MKKLSNILNSGLLGQNGALLCAIVALVLTGLFASCAKSEIAQEDSIANAAQSGAAGEMQDDPAGDDQGNSDDPQGDPSDSDSPSLHGSDYISPDHFNMVQMTFDACADIEDKSSQTPAPSGAFAETKGLFTPENAASREEFLDEEDTRTHLGDVVNNKQQIYWDKGDKIKIYYYPGTSNYDCGTIKHDGTSSTIDGLVNESDHYYYAFYPYNESATAGIVTSVTYEGDPTYAYGAFTVTVPTTQDGKFANCHMAVGKASKDEKQFAFSNVGSYLKMTVAKPAGATSVQITSLGDAIAGTFTAPFLDDDGTLDAENISIASGATNTITVSLRDITSGDDIYVSMLPGVTFNKGFLVRYIYSDGVTRPSWFYAPASPKTVNRRKILNCGPLDTRIVTNWFFKSGSSISSPSSLGNGATWEKALNAAGLVALLNSNSADSDISAAQAARLDGATFHFADGTYTTASEIVFSAPTYGENVNLTLLGGYPASNTGTTTNNRSASNHATIISGNKEVSHHRIFYLESPLELSLDNFKITEAYTETGNGGGFYMEGTSTSDCALSLNQVWFYDNYVENQPTTTNGSGGAVALSKGALVATNCTFENGSGRNAGGVLVKAQLGVNAATARFTDCTFTGNQTQSNCGAGLSANGGQISLIRCTFTNNHAALFGGGVHWDVSSSASPSLELSGCIFEGNYTNDATVGAHGGAISCQSGTLTLSNCSFTENHAGANNSKGGAIWVQGNVSGSNLTFTDNYASGDGGAVYVNNSGQFSMLSGENSFSGNYSGYVDADTFADTEGGAIYMAGSGSNVHIKGNTSFNENYSLKRAGAISFRGGTLKVENDGDNRPSFFKNNTIVEYESGDVISNVNGGAVGVYATTGTVTLTGCDFDANYLMGDADFANCYAEGGSLAISAGSATDLTVSVTDCLFTNSYSGTNTLNNVKSATARNGGALHLNINKDNAGTIRFSSCNFHKNRCWNCGGMAAHTSGVVSFSDECTFTENTARVYSGVYHMNHRDATANFNNCILSGNSSWDDGTGSVTRLEGGTLTLTSCTLSGNQSIGSSGSGVISMPGADSNLIVRGSTFQDNTAQTGNGGAIYFGAGSLTITSSDGTASGTKSVIRGNTGNSYGRGYAIYVNGDDKSTLTPSISYCVFDAKNSSGDVAPTSGHAIYFAGTTGSEALTMTGCEIKNFNRGTNTGLWWTNLLDAANHTAASALSFTGCTFEQNTSPVNGGVFNYHRNVYYTLSLSYCTFNLNAAVGSGTQGGAIFAEKALTLDHCTFSNNSASNDSGGALTVNINVSGKEHDDETSSDGFYDHVFTTDHCIFTNNSAQYAGAVYVRSGRYVANGDTFTGNTASASGVCAGGAVGLWYHKSQASLNACTFTNNRASNGKGGAVAQQQGVVKINACSFTGNFAKYRGGAFYAEGGKDSWGFAYMNNSKFIGNSVGKPGDEYGSAIFCSMLGWLFANGLLVAENYAASGSVDDSPVSGSARILFTNCTFLSNVTKSNSGIFRYETQYGSIFHSIFLPTDDSSVRNSVFFSDNFNNINSYYSIFDGINKNGKNGTFSETGNVTGKRPSDLGNYSWDSTNKMYSWNGSVSGYTNYASTSAMWTAILNSHRQYETIPSSSDGRPANVYFESATNADGGIAKTFVDWLDECGGGAGTGRNKDILGHTRTDAQNYPGCRAY
ncbi:MAG: hypothetical protein IJU13_09165 [Bacteroidales bacterium]|nr:hypothetical protein [Bacteroidales bacterium]